MKTREHLVFLASVAEQAERYKDAYLWMKEALRVERSEINSKERELLSIGAKNVIGTYRSASRILQSIEQKAENKNDPKKEYVTRYVQQVHAEAVEFCNDCINVLDDLISHETNKETL